MTPCYHYNCRLRFLPASVLAFTVGRHIFVRGRDAPYWLQRHEETHVRQFARYGIVGFFLRFWWWNWWYGRHLNPLEIEARAATRRTPWPRRVTTSRG